ncbi:hypothetical protein CCMA1212_008597 [Trichoderma ghanense]|uniref:Uncharacterized protein n=1 Tax=Trichoderma ghanense TaxID=65468 RepID=A0ABY2GVL7_9HYPO
MTVRRLAPLRSAAAKAQEHRGWRGAESCVAKSWMRRAMNDEEEASRPSSDSEGWSRRKRGQERQDVADDGHTETSAATGTMQCTCLGAASFSLSPRTGQREARVESRDTGSRRSRVARSASLRCSKCSVEQALKAGTKGAGWKPEDDGGDFSSQNSKRPDGL